MHQDQRIGLALAVLLVGACAAFFFRNETRGLRDTPSLKSAAELDQRIVERSNRPYIKGIEAVETADRRAQRRPEDQQPNSADTLLAKAMATSWNSLGLIVGREKSPKPIPPAPNRDAHSTVRDLDPQLAASDPLAEDDDHEVTQLSPTDVQVAGNGERMSPSSNAQTYVVQKGDSLSSIAAKLLGDRNRFPELYEANRDQLPDANSLKLGQVLRLPAEPGGTVAVLAKIPQPDSAKPAEAVVEQSELSSTRVAEVTPPLVDVGSGDSTIMSQERPLVPPTPESSDLAPGNPAAKPSVTSETTEPKKFVPARRAAASDESDPKSKSPRKGHDRRLSKHAPESASDKIVR